MLKQRLAPVLALVLALFAPFARAYFDPPWITPENPRAGETVYVNIHGGICDAIATTPGYPQITQNGNAILFTVFGVHEEDLNWCNFGEGTGVYAVGAYAPGNYVLTVEMRYIDPLAPEPPILAIGTVAFTVRGLPPASVPTTGFGSLAALLALLAAMAVYSIRRNHGAHLLLAALALVPLGARANGQYIINCVQGGSGAPTPVRMVSWLSASPRTGKPPLQAYSAVTPLGGNHLIPDRAAGDFLTWLAQNPQSARRR
ncbi:MAG TPA: hypothetical protein VF422_06110, partial [Dokdonella sp.]